ncbi:MAG: hypothetical protein FJ125_12690 [Deltaproteobacteria bacterium]|nr:hypothetical protein [Deltaproteobacteria bacterium]
MFGASPRWALDQERLRLLERGPGKGVSQAWAPGEAEAVHGAGRGERLACAFCGWIVTSGSERIEVAGAHAHTFANPYGIVYRLGCFGAAPGCIPFAGESDQFPWFAGHTWQIVICGRCGVHLGWLFRAEQRRFFGLVLDHLVEEERRQQQS